MRSESCFDHCYRAGLRVLTLCSATPAALEIPADSMFCPVTSPASPSTAIAITRPIPPPAQIRKDPPALQRVVFPEKESCAK